MSPKIEIVTARRCAICDRTPGHAPLDRFGQPDLNPETPLGELQICDCCGLLVCPDCSHENECCFRDAEDHAHEPNWAPPGWVSVDRENFGRSYRRIK